MAKRLHYESVYQNYWSQYINNLDNDDTVEIGKHVEIRLDDGSRCDVFYTDSKGRQYAIEVDFIDKFYQSIGQASRYALATSRRPGILIIMENPTSDREIRKLNVLKEILEHLRVKMEVGKNKRGRPRYRWFEIKLWIITPEDLNNAI